MKDPLVGCGDPGSPVSGIIVGMSQAEDDTTQKLLAIYLHLAFFDFAMTRISTPLFLPILVFLAAFVTPLEAKKEKPLIYVPVLPYEWMFERIGGDWIEVRSLVGEGDDCHDYSPSPKQLTQLARANLIFSGDLGFEANFFVKVGDGISAPKEISLLEELDLLEGSCEICNHGSQGKEESHEEHEHAHHEELKDPHVWLSPKLLSQQATRIAGILKEHTADEANSKIDQNLAALLADLKAIDAELKEALAPIKGETFYVYHGAFAYFADAYGLTQKAIESMGRRPSPKQIGQLAKQAKADGVKLIFVQPQFDQSSAVSLAKTIGGDVAELDPLDKNVLTNLRKIASVIRNRKG
ncbi:MAG: zinc ABC transporter substrate-binding protein [Planctomycetota bacterium]